ncbi:MAG: hypothetical protein ACEY3J_04300 [Arsenophonus sp.]
MIKYHDYEASSLENYNYKISSYLQISKELESIFAKRYVIAELTFAKFGKRNDVDDRLCCQRLFAKNLLYCRKDFAAEVTMKKQTVIKIKEILAITPCPHKAVSD